MTSPLSPASLAELSEAVRSVPRVLAMGAGSKPRLFAVEAVMISTRAISAITEYEPSEFTFTALAGTPVREIVAALAERGQYLPFDPMLLEAGATLGGTVAAGLSGPGRFRFGGLRDFILGVRFVDGAGRLLRMGGKVVKNAAGFDLPKFFVGSLGRFGVLGEITFKVFPRPTDSLTLRLPMTDPEWVTQLFAQAANSRWELDAMDWQPDGQSVCLRLAGPLAALEPIAREIIARWPGEILGPSAADKVWSELREFRWAPADDALIKIALTVSQISGVHELVKSVTGARLHVSAGGDLAFVSLPATTSAASLDEQLGALGLSAVTLRGTAPLWLGARARPKLTQAVKDALDPEKRFPSLDD